jgi:regulator of protease activity HflC (stomatin/prohibitin superfamily)
MTPYLLSIPILIILVVLSGIFIVHQQRVIIIERFGKFLKIAYPGLRVKIPLVDAIAAIIDLRIQQLNVQVETKTKDNVFLKIIVSVQYQVISSKIYESYYKLSSPKEQIEAYVFDVVRAKVPKIELDDVFSKKDDIANEVKSELQETMHDLGFEIIKALVTDIQPNENVKNAMNEINTAQRLKLAVKERAEAEKITRIKQAEAEAEANILQGKGIAGQRFAIMEGLGQSLHDLQKHHPHLSADSIMQTILMIQYFDMLKALGDNSKNNTVFANHSPNHVSDLFQQFREIILTPKV